MHRLLYLLVFSSLAVSPLPGLEAEVRIVGSDYLEAPVREILRRAAERGVDLPSYELRMHGSRLAWPDLESGRPVLGLIAEPAADPATGEEWIALPFTWSAVVVLVNARNQLSHLRLDRLAGILGENEEFSFQLWSDLGMREWSGRRIHAVLLDSGASPTRDLVLHRLLREPIFRAGVHLSSDIEEILETIARNEAAIGLTDFPPTRRDVRILPLLAEEGSAPVFPEGATMQAGEYPLRLEYRMVVHKSVLANESLRVMAETLFSLEGASVLRQYGFFPVPDDSRQDLWKRDGFRAAKKAVDKGGGED